MCSPSKSRSSRTSPSQSLCFRRSFNKCARRPNSLHAAAKCRMWRRSLPGDPCYVVHCLAGEALVPSAVSNREVRLGNLLGIAAARPNSLGCIDKEELPHFVVGQLPNRHSESENGIFKLF